MEKNNIDDLYNNDSWWSLVVQRLLVESQGDMKQMGAVATNNGFVETIHSPSIMKRLSNDMTTFDVRTYDHDNDEIIHIIPVVASNDNTHQIRYDTYVNGAYDRSYTVNIIVLNDGLWYVFDYRHNVYLTLDSAQTVSQSITVSSRLECVADPVIFGHGRASDYTNCHWQGSGTISITPTNGNISWSAPASIDYWFLPYVFDEVRINPDFATSNVFYTNIRSGSMSFDGMYGADTSHAARIILCYGN